MTLNIRPFVFFFCTAGMILAFMTGCYKKHSDKKAHDTESADSASDLSTEVSSDSDTVTGIATDVDSDTPIIPDSESSDSESETDSRPIESHCRAPEFENMIPVGSDAAATTDISIDFDDVTFSAVSTEGIDARIGWADFSDYCSTGIWMGTTTAENAASDRVSLSSGFAIRMDFQAQEDTAFGLSFVARVPLGAKILVTLFDAHQEPLSSNQFQPLPAADPECIPDRRYPAAEQRLTLFSDVPVTAAVIEASDNFIFHIKDIYFSTASESSPACPWVNSDFFEDPTTRCDILNVAYPGYRCIDRPANKNSCDSVTAADFNGTLNSAHELGCFREVEDLICGPVTYKEPDECCFYISESETELCLD
ncbi:MAG: hypothetical protein JXX14_01070 [Deltaproteobacteria bacterium]|nr:hypothetical protein [Deltaproteobacteria bacterium]